MKTPVTILTGFLGSGKTTLLTHLVSHVKDRRIAIVVNEFGEIGIDGNLIESSCGCEEGSIIELKNGCVCCTVQEEFLPTMKKLLNAEERFDHILVETSGLALPKPLLKAINWPDLKPLLTVDAVLTVVDTDGLATGEICDRKRVQKQREADEELDHETPIEELFADQLSCADLVVLTKPDLVPCERLGEIKDVLQQRLRPHIRIVEAERGQLAPEIALGLAANAEDDLANRPSHHDDHHHHHHDHEHGHNHDHEHHHHHDHEHDDSINSVALKPGPITQPKRYLKELEALCEAHEIYRIKGFLDIPGKPMRMVIQGVGKRFETYFDRPWKPDEARQSYVVVIGKHVQAALQPIAAAG